VVGILSHSQEVQVLHYLAALAAQLTPAILTPPNRKLNKQYYLETMTRVVARCHFAAIVTDVEGFTPAARLFTPGSLLERGEAAAVSGPASIPEAAFLQFSSGTTGIKRGVLVREGAVLEQLRAYGEALALTPEDCLVSWLPLYHDMGFIACLNLPLAWGVHAVMLHPLDWVARPVSFLRAVTRYRATLAWNPNFAYAFMADRTREVDLPELELSTLRGLVNCSEPVTRESQARFSSRFASRGLREDVFLGCYAMAETTYALTHGRPVEHAGRLSVGRALPGVELRVCDDAGAELPRGAVGELRVRSAYNADGYFENAEATAAAFEGGWYRTGDLGYQQGGEYFVCGRKKDVLIVGGVNVFPEDIEEVIGRVEGVQPGRVAVFSDFDEQAQTERVTILVEPSATATATLSSQLQQQVLAALQLANFSIHLVEPGWLVKSSSGKMARSANREKWAKQP
jgi:acyl-CoA synthetase (AMP-forming)/AMP-acid ligase II